MSAFRFVCSADEGLLCGQVLAPGMRVGWVTAAPALIQKIIYQLQGIHLGANSFTQVSCCLASCLRTRFMIIASK